MPSAFEDILLITFIHTGTLYVACKNRWCMHLHFHTLIIKNVRICHWFKLFIGHKIVVGQQLIFAFQFYQSTNVQKWSAPNLA